VLTAVILAFLTYKLAERPIRFGQRAKTVKTGALIALIAVVGGAGLYAWLENGFPKRAIAENMAASLKMLENHSFQDEAGLKYAREHVPAVPQNAYYPSISFMRAAIAPDSKASIALLGDSHAWAAYPGLAKRNAEFGISTILMADGDHRAAILGSSPHKDDIQKRLNHKANEWIDYLRHDKNIKQVYIFNYWLRTISHPEKFKQAVQNTINKLNAFDKEVFVVADVPTLPFEIRSKILRPFQFKNKASATFTLSAEQNERHKKYLELLDSLENATIIKNTAEAFCPEGKCIALSPEGLPLYSNSHHLSTLGSDYLVEHVLEPYLARID
jgi:hypothetical protein